MISSIRHRISCGYLYGDYRRPGLFPILLCAVLTASGVSSLSPNVFSEVHSSRFGSFNFTELEDVVYDVELLRVPKSEGVFDNEEGKSPSETVETDRKETSQKLEARPEHVILVSKHGQRYSCKLPWEQPGGDYLEKATSEPDMNIKALLLPLSDKPCLIKTMGWWTYEYCHGKFVRQYHLEAGKVIGKTVYLGFYDNETVWDKAHIERVQNVIDSMKDNIGHGAYPVAYHGVTFVNGTICDLTGKPRLTKVRLHCSVTGEDKLFEVVERETCNYTIVVQTSLLCGNPFFDITNRERAQTLACSPLVSEVKYQSYQQEQERFKEEENEEEELKPNLKNMDSSYRDHPTPDDDVHKIHGESSPLSDLFTSKSSDKTGDHYHKDTPHTTDDEKAPQKSTKEETKDIESFSVDDFEGTIELLYKQLVESLDEHKDSDPVAAQLKHSVQTKYNEFEKLKETRALQKITEEKMKTDEKDFKAHDYESETHSKEIEPFEVQGVRTGQASDGEETEQSNEEMPSNIPDVLKMSLTGHLDEKQLRGLIEGLFDEEEADGRSEEVEEIREQLRENGLSGGAEVKVFTLPSSVTNLFDDKEENKDSEDDEAKSSTIKVVHFKLSDGEGQSLTEDGQKDSANTLSKILGSFYNTVPEEPLSSPEQRKVKELEDSYEQVWGEQTNTDKQRKT